MQNNLKINIAIWYHTFCFSRLHSLVPRPSSPTIWVGKEGQWHIARLGLVLLFHAVAMKDYKRVYENVLAVEKKLDIARKNLVSLDFGDTWRCMWRIKGLETHHAPIGIIFYDMCQGYK